MNKEKKTVKHDFTKNEENEKMIERTELENSPFIVVTTEEGSFGTLGKYRLTEVYKDKQKCIDEMHDITWNRIIQVVSLVNQILNEA